MPDRPDPLFLESLTRLGLVRPGEEARFVPLRGGVSSDIWKVELPGRAPVCAKRALPKLKVAADWHVPTERSASEAAYFGVVARLVRGAVPPVLGYDEGAKLFVMPWLDPEKHRLWKTELAAGRVNADDAAAVGDRLAHIHSAAAADRTLATRFATDALFHALRLEPYLEATAARHPALASELHALVRRTASIKRSLVHGDVSPKNILLGPQGPVFLDAECAWWGDPAFDLAFVVNHLLLKRFLVPATGPLLQAFRALVEAYGRRASWEPWEEVDRRAASLLPALLLARIDGKSPVEYITAEEDRKAVRCFAIPFVIRPPARLLHVAEAWAGRFP